MIITLQCHEIRVVAGGVASMKNFLNVADGVEFGLATIGAACCLIGLCRARGNNVDMWLAVAGIIATGIGFYAKTMIIGIATNACAE